MMETKFVVLDAKNAGTAMDRAKKRLKAFGEGFVDGVLNQATDDTTFYISAAAGIYQGLKYKGSVKRGVGSAVAVWGCISIANGILNGAKKAKSIRYVY